MKSIIKEKKKILLKSGYADDLIVISAEKYSKLNEKQKKLFKLQKVVNGIPYSYYKEGNIPEYSTEEFETILKLNQAETLLDIKNCINTIKNYLLFFTIVLVVCIIIYVIGLISIMY